MYGVCNDGLKDKICLYQNAKKFIKSLTSFENVIFQLQIFKVAITLNFKWSFILR